MKRHTAFGIRGFALGVISGGLAIGIPLSLRLLDAAHHYDEYEVFFEGQLGKREVRGISYFDYHGLGFMESNRWRVDLIRPRNPDATTIYSGRPVFQEALPHQPKVSILGESIYIDDGEQVLTVHVTESKAEQDAAANP